MKCIKLTLVLLLVASSAQAGTFGKAFGGSFLGSTFSNVLTRPSSRVVHVTESSDSRATNKALKNLQNEFDDFYDNVKKMFKSVATVVDNLQNEVNSLQQEVSKLKEEKSSSVNKNNTKEASKNNTKETPKKQSLWQNIKDIF